MGKVSTGSQKKISQWTVLFVFFSSGILSSCGGSEFTEGGRSRRNLRGDSANNGNLIELSSQSDLRHHQGADCSGAQLTDGYGSPTPKKDHSYGGYGNPNCTSSVPPAPSVPPKPPTTPPGVPGQPPQNNQNQFPLSLLTGLVCTKTPKELYNVAQFVGSQSKDQFQYLINAGLTGNLTIDQLVIYGQIAKSLTEQQIADWKARVCVGTQPIAECRMPPSGPLPDDYSKCLPIPPQVGKIDDSAGQTLIPPPSLDDSGKGNT
jgi:hypothetical protein